MGEALEGMLGRWIFRMTQVSAGLHAGDDDARMKGLTTIPKNGKVASFTVTRGIVVGGMA